MRKIRAFVLIALFLLFTHAKAQNFHLVKDINTLKSSDPVNNYPNFFDMKGFFPVSGNKAWFSANDGKTGVGIWQSDGTSQGTILVKTICPGVSTSASISNIISFNNGIAFLAEIDGSSQLWV